ncbi:MAG: hypothetical protein QW046_05580 [Candidatus Micrarchaeaceae archaeon]
MVFGIDPEDYLEFENPKQFYDWVLTLKPKDLKNEKNILAIPVLPKEAYQEW